MRRLWVFGWLLLLGAPIALTACSHSAPPLRDDQIVQCLSPSRQPELAAAAAALDDRLSAAQGRIVTPTATLDPGRWAKDNRAAFTRACQAMTYVAPPKPADGPLPTVVSILLPVLAGGLVALVSTEWRNASTVAVRHADDLGDAADAFLVAAREYRAARQAGRTPQAGPYEEAYEKLAAQLARVSRFRPGWRQVPEARRLLTERLTREQAHDGDIEPALTTLSERLAGFDRALRRPWRPHLGVRRA
ncbi:hypothetical protein AB0K18_43870 [Nonomuraea sp. NPDC049421]|uniref:hypothetical protein n=1 Tax=Nonomuraea sp. NPDC049421 TaxID=3155275 RepID=UPI00343C2580